MSGENEDEPVVGGGVTVARATELMIEKREEAKSSRQRARFAAETYNLGRGNRNVAMTRLAQAFPSLSSAPGVDPFDSIELARWVKSSKSHGEICAVKFLLSVWNDDDLKDGCYGISPFDLKEALGVWDRHHRQAFVGWVEEPRWP